MSFQFESLNVKNSFDPTYVYRWKITMYFLIRLTERRDTYPNSLLIYIFPARWVRSLLNPDFVWFAFWDGPSSLASDLMTKLHTMESTFCRDLSFLLLNLSFCLRRRCYRRFCSSSMVLFWCHVGFARGLSTICRRLCGWSNSISHLIRR